MYNFPNWRDSPITGKYGCLILVGMSIILGVGIFMLGKSITENQNLKDDIENEK